MNDNLAKAILVCLGSVSFGIWQENYFACMFIGSILFALDLIINEGVEK